jgi:ABC-2 type transport system permease protein
MARPGIRPRIRHRIRLRAAAAALAAAGAVLLSLSGCTSSNGISAARLQASISRAFASLYVLQQADQGNPKTTARSLHSRASCQKGTPSTPQNGAGGWLCQITYLVAGPGYPVIARYTVDVQTDGCYAADGDGPASVNGSPTVTGPHYRQVINPLWLIDGCFDTT